MVEEEEEEEEEDDDDGIIFGHVAEAMKANLRRSATIASRMMHVSGAVWGTWDASSLCMGMDAHTHKPRAHVCSFTHAYTVGAFTDGDKEHAQLVRAVSGFAGHVAAYGLGADGRR
jgi:hypothetical protein